MLRISWTYATRMLSAPYTPTKGQGGGGNFVTQPIGAAQQPNIFERWLATAPLDDSGGKYKDYVSPVDSKTTRIEGTSSFGDKYNAKGASLASTPSWRG